MNYGDAACEPMTTPENKKKAEIINNRLNSLSIDTNANLKCIRDINGFLFAPQPQCEGEDKKEAKVAGWFEYIIDMLTTISNTNSLIRNELEKLRKELKDKQAYK